MTHMNHHILSKIIVAFLLVAFLIPFVSAATITYDKTGVIAAVIDGSTVSLASSQMIKLAGIQTPAQNAPGYTESKSYLTTLLPAGATVYLEEDALNVSLCVIYLDYNSTHYENINKAMLQNGYAAPNSTNSEFDPTKWTEQFIAKQTSDPSPTPLTTSEPTATPTATPFTAPTPSLTPDTHQPTATIPTTSPQNMTETPIESWIIGAIIISVVAAAVFLGFILKKRK